MENRKPNQIVFVIMDNYENKVVGVYNDYAEAAQVAEAAEKDFYEDDYITITPVLVDTVNIVPDSRKLYWNEQGVVDALQEELDLAMPYVEEEEEEEDEEWTPCDDCYHPYACEMCDYAEDEEEEIDPIESMIFDYKGKRAITDSAGKLLLDTCYEVVNERNPSMPFDAKVRKAKAMMTAIAKDYGIEWVTEEGE